MPDSAGSDCEQECKNSDNVEYTFGNYVDTSDWIECVSLRHPGTTYYHNLNSRCSTWIRPVPPEIKLVRFDKRKSRVFNNNSEPDDHIDYTLMKISSDSETDSEMTKSRKAKNLTTLLRMYYDSISDMKNNNDDDDFMPVEVYGGEESEPDLHNFLIERNVDIEQKICNDLHLSTAASDFLEVDLNMSKSDIEIQEEQEVKQYKFENEFSSFERSEESMSEEGDCFRHNPLFSSDENIDAHPTHVINIFRLPSITPDCLKQPENKYIIKKPQRKKRMVKKKPEPMRKRTLKPKPIICHMYGNTTINYNDDFMEPFSIEQRKLPPGVSVSQLSESSVTSSTWQQENVPINFNNIVIPNVSQNLNLSSPSSSSSSSCSTCCSTCCSSSSETDSSSSTSTTNSKTGD